MIPVLTIPFLNRPDLLERCLTSIDYPVDRLVLVDNSSRSIGRAVAERQAPGRCIRLHIIEHANSGVAASWNEVIKLFPAPWWLLVNNDIAFAPGDLEKVSAFISKEYTRNDAPPLACAYANHGASAWAVTLHGIQTVGLFDENIFPAYLEDCDWSYRADLLGARRANIPDCHLIHGDDFQTGSCTVNSDPRLQRLNATTHGGNFDYYRRKWGGSNGQETFKVPFNHPHWPVWAWKFEPQIRLRQQQVWESK